jgi:phosphoribosyl 1,2-cyclic phosphodiesterase
MSIQTANALGVEGTHRIEDGERHHIGTWTVDAFATIHDCPGSLGFVVTNQEGEKLCFVTDTQYLSPHWGDGCEILALEANYSLDKLKENVGTGDVDRSVKHRVLWNHQSIETVLKFLEKTDRSRLVEVVLLHLSSENSDEVAFKRRAAEIVGVPVHIA